ncbi:glycosyltransferase family 2 protein [Escherichia coli]|nr:glycosyltransferase family 2 protein [Escherichia coli]
MIYVSVISHGHFKTLKELGAVSKLNNHSRIKVIIKDNLGESELLDFCQENKITYLRSKEKKGFGENNNEVFSSISSLITKEDFFVVMNPDIYIECSDLLDVVDECGSANVNLATINLYRDFDKKTYDNSVRKFPSAIDFFMSFLFKKNDCVVNKNKITKPTYVDWAAGSFLIFNAFFYSKLNGFNEKYFMYCEDIDICWRAKKHFNTSVLYYPCYAAIHLAQFNNRRIFSRAYKKYYPFFII